jgi:dienelactone hydrolase
LQLEKKLDPGKYRVDVQGMNGALVHGVIGIKGRATGQCDSDGDRLTEQSPDNEDPPRYSWPYLLVKPVQRAADAPTPVGAGTTLLVVPNNTGFPSKDSELLRASAICELGFGAISGPLAIADGLGAPLLKPLFPRPEEPYLQALTRASLKQDLEPKFNRVDKQLIAMIDDARAKLASMDYPVQLKVLMAGFSASGVFTNRFAVLHPERVLAAAVGGPGGWPIVPVRADQGETLPYPVGIADLDNGELSGHAVDLAALQRVHFLFLLGDGDTNDATPGPDSYSEAHAELINRLFGTVGQKCGEAVETVVKRWWPAQRLYYVARLDARFRLYPGVSHSMGMTPVMWNDVLETFRKALGAR